MQLIIYMYMYKRLADSLISIRIGLSCTAYVLLMTELGVPSENLAQNISISVE